VTVPHPRNPPEPGPDPARRIGYEVSALSILAGANINHIRTRAGLTARELREKSDVSEPMIFAIENGRRNVGLGGLAAIAEALGVAPPVLLRDPGLIRCARCGGRPQPWTQCLSCGTLGERS
jgi:hypothetical protein